MREPLSQLIAIVPAILPSEGVAAMTDLPADKVLDLDAYGASSVLIVVTFGAITGSAATSIKAQVDNVLTFDDDPLDIAGTAQTVADTKDDGTFVIDVFNSPRRFVRLFVARATANAVVSSAFYLVYGMRNKPVVQAAPVETPEIHIDKSTGSA